MQKENYFLSPVIEKIEDALDVNFNVSETKIDTFEQFNDFLFTPFSQGDTVFYRGESVYSAERRLTPTILRRGAQAFPEITVNKLVNIDNTKLLDFYTSKKRFVDIYTLLYGGFSADNMYNMAAFAQHYLDMSPFIDFTKSLYVALSFALKGKTQVPHDFVIYTARDIASCDVITDIDEANECLKNYSVNVINTENSSDIKSIIEKRIAGSHKSAAEIIEELKQKSLKNEFKKIEAALSALSPGAKLINIPTNDLMKFQQGVFLLLDGFSLVDSKYLTKNIRAEFEIKKYIINGNLAPFLQKILCKNAPEYSYENLLNISKAVCDERR